MTTNSEALVSAQAATPVAWQYRVHCGGAQGWSRWTTAEKSAIDAMPDRHLAAIFEIRALYPTPPTATPAPDAGIGDTAPAGARMVSVPMHMTAKMRRVFHQEEGCTWSDLLWAAEAITEKEFDEVERLEEDPQPSDAPQQGRCVGWRAVWRSDGGYVWHSSRVLRDEQEADRVLTHWAEIHGVFSVEHGGQFRFEKEALYPTPQPSDTPQQGTPILEVWNGVKKVTIYSHSVIRSWGANIELEMSDNPNTPDEVAASLRWLYATQQPQPAQPSEGLLWSAPLPPNGGKTSFYDHCYAETPLGRMMIEWKSWKEGWDQGHDVALGEAPIFHESADDLEDAKRKGEDHLRKVAREIMSLVGDAARSHGVKGVAG